VFLGLGAFFTTPSKLTVQAENLDCTQHLMVSMKALILKKLTLKGKKLHGWT
jgi:hypothetical protein